ncbi:MAG TPA: hypothetical protein VFU36_07335 [Jatrophihabitans sp.]|nr:hypothetical protein [Jatrophihabitans sp.]
MTSSRAKSSATNASYTLVRALQWLGHNCSGCPAATEDILQAPVCFIRREITHPMVGEREHPRPMATSLVVIDLADSSLCSEDRRQLLRAVNQCTQPDRIRVRPRRDTDSGRAWAAVDREGGRYAGADYRVFRGTRRRP